ncbi:DUF6894 family protein [Bradyrhizobium shewense]|uniref:DUF6894 family protein n=1 Tax=Bradyrhizobium shewense TaxID=1761772 RepID=UPI003D318FAD
MTLLQELAASTVACCACSIRERSGPAVVRDPCPGTSSIFTTTSVYLPDLDAARDAALRALAEAIRGKSEVRAEIGQMSVIVRTQIARVLTVSASIEISLTS